MATIILALVTQRGAVSFPEIVNAIGDDTRGDLAWEVTPNLVLWAGISKSIIKTFESLKDAVEPCTTNVLVYLNDGPMLNLRVAKRANRKGYKEPHWLPIVFNPRKEATRSGAQRGNARKAGRLSSDSKRW